MVIVRILGGLGNQMFHYAAGKRLSLVRGVKLKLDISHLRRKGSRDFLLNAFNVDEKIAKRGEIRSFKYGRMPWKYLFNKNGRKKARHLNNTFLLENNNIYDPQILEAPGEVYLQGRFQSEKYFEDVAETISDCFSLRTPSRSVQSLMDEMAGGGSVSIHVRRGDYIVDPEIHRRFGSCSQAYYENCMEIVYERLNDPRFYIFSDEPAWVRQNMSFPYGSIYVAPEDLEDDAEGLMAMSACRHNIIANSTYSWWSAWLNRRPDKVVYAPTPWFQREKVDLDLLLPETWIRILDPDRVGSSREKEIAGQQGG